MMRVTLDVGPTRDGDLDTKMVFDAGIKIRGKYIWGCSTINDVLDKADIELIDCELSREGRPWVYNRELGLFETTVRTFVIAMEE